MWLWLLGAAWAGVDLNTASVVELDTLPGVGPVKAATIVAWRTEHGRFGHPSEVLDVPGISLATWRALEPLVEASAGDVPDQEPSAVVLPPACQPREVNLNTASAEELLTLPGMVPSRAAAILHDRDLQGAFATCQEAIRVVGISQATVATWGPRCVTH